MKTVVRIIYVQAGGTQDEVFSYPGIATADAICRALDDLEARGVAFDGVTTVSIVAKRGIGADALVCSHHATPLEQMDVEVTRCAA